MYPAISTTLPTHSLPPVLFSCYIMVTCSIWTTTCSKESSAICFIMSRVPFMSLDDQNILSQNLLTPTSSAILLSPVTRHNMPPRKRQEVGSTPGSTDKEPSIARAAPKKAPAKNVTSERAPASDTGRKTKVSAKNSTATSKSMYSDAIYF